MYIGLLSDTHGTFDNPFQYFFEPVDEIWHAGDFGNLVTAEKIASFKPLKGVHGNCDGQDLRFDYPAFLSFDCEGMKVLMTHIGGYPGKYDRRALQLILEYRPDIFVCGHSHILRVMNDGYQSGSGRSVRIPYGTHGIAFPYRQRQDTRHGGI